MARPVKWLPYQRGEELRWDMRGLRTIMLAADSDNSALPTDIRLARLIIWANERLECGVTKTTEMVDVGVPRLVWSKNKIKTKFHSAASVSVYLICFYQLWSYNGGVTRTSDLNHILLSKQIYCFSPPRQIFRQKSFITATLGLWWQILLWRIL